MSTKTGGPAFPIVEQYPANRGMTLRDYFAAQVLPALCTHYKACIAAEKAYDIADAMLAAREL